MYKKSMWCWSMAAALALLSAPKAMATEAFDVVEHYADIALAKYEDSLTTAKALNDAINKLIEAPSEETLEKAKSAWLASRIPYQQSEVFRFGNIFVDEWEGKVNAWPLDEGLIDYVDGSYGDSSDENAAYTANIIGNTSLKIGGETIDATVITPDLIKALHEVDEIEANVATGYHAIEFLLWGQDLNGTEAGAGERPWTDYAKGSDCTKNNCDRRADYLNVASEVLVGDLEEAVAAWSEGGVAREDLLSKSPEEGLSVILTGMGSLSYGEQAGERMQLGLMLHDPEEEHDCFSDNTHNSHFYDGLGIQNVYHGRYERIDGRVLEGPGLSDLTAAIDKDLDAEMTARLKATMQAMSVMKETADSGKMAYDQMIGEGNEEGNAIVQAAINGLVDQTQSIERIVAAFGLAGIEFEGSDSLDNPTAVFQ